MRMRKIRILLPVLLIGLMTAVGQTGYYIPSERFSSGLINDLTLRDSSKTYRPGDIGLLEPILYKYVLQGMPPAYSFALEVSHRYKLPKTGDTSTPLSDYLQRNTVVAAMMPRIQLLFHVAMYNGCEALVLGAWGCGAYGLDPHLVASMFKAYLCYDASIIGKDSRLQRIVFAIKTSADNHNVLKDNYSPFRTAFDDPGLLDLAAIIR